MAGVALVIGIVIGAFLQPAPDASWPEASDRSTPEAGRLEGIDESKAATSTSSSMAQGEHEGARAGRPPPSGTSSRRGVAVPAEKLASSESRLREPDPGNGYYDETFPPDEPARVVPAPVDEDGAASDYALYGDGPALRRGVDLEGSRAYDLQPDATPDEGVETESCLPPLTAGCKRDSDCCGTSLCRSRPGTISGHFECSAG